MGDVVVVDDKNQSAETDQNPSGTLFHHVIIAAEPDAAGNFDAIEGNFPNKSAVSQCIVDASNIIQETYLQTARRMDDFLRRRPMPFRLWLRKSACECLIQLRRRHVGAKQQAITAEVG